MLTCAHGRDEWVLIAIIIWDCGRFTPPDPIAFPQTTPSASKNVWVVDQDPIGPNHMTLLKVKNNLQKCYIYKNYAYFVSRVIGHIEWEMILLNEISNFDNYTEKLMLRIIQLGDFSSIEIVF
jgi:hypothetical protein